MKESDYNPKLEISEHTEAKPLDISISSIEKEGRENQDTVISDKKDSKYAGVFDGVGGNKGGEVASKEAAQIIEDHLKDLKQKEKSIKGISYEKAKEFIKKAIKLANDFILDHQKADKRLKEMATTASVVYFWKDKNSGEIKPIIANIGDSRVYRQREDNLEHMTIDDNQSKYVSSDKNYIKKLQKEFASIKNKDELEGDENLTKEEKLLLWENKDNIENAIGSKKINVKITEIKDFQEGDKVIITSDGIHDSITDEEIIENSNNAENLVSYAKERSQSADNERAKPDDISAVVVEYKEIEIKDTDSPEEGFELSVSEKMKQLEDDLDASIAGHKLVGSSEKEVRKDIIYLIKKFNKDYSLDLSEEIMNELLEDAIREVFLSDEEKSKLDKILELNYEELPEEIRQMLNDEYGQDYFDDEEAENETRKEWDKKTLKEKRDFFEVKIRDIKIKIVHIEENIKETEKILTELGMELADLNNELNNAGILKNPFGKNKKRIREDIESKRKVIKNMEEDLIDIEKTLTKNKNILEILGEKEEEEVKELNLDEIYKLEYEDLYNKLDALKLYELNDRLEFKLYFDEETKSEWNDKESQEKKEFFIKTLALVIKQLEHECKVQAEYIEKMEIKLEKKEKKSLYNKFFTSKEKIEEQKQAIKDSEESLENRKQQLERYKNIYNIYKPEDATLEKLLDKNYDDLTDETRKRLNEFYPDIDTKIIKEEWDKSNNEERKHFLKIGEESEREEPITTDAEEVSEPTDNSDASTRTPRTPTATPTKTPIPRIPPVSANIKKSREKSANSLIKKGLFLGGAALATTPLLAGVGVKEVWRGLKMWGMNTLNILTKGKLGRKISWRDVVYGEMDFFSFKIKEPDKK